MRWRAVVSTGLPRPLRPAAQYTRPKGAGDVGDWIPEQEGEMSGTGGCGVDAFDFMSWVFKMLWKGGDVGRDLGWEES